MKNKSFFAALILFSLSISACSESTSSPDISKVAKEYISAQSSKEWKTVCDLLTKESQNGIAQSVAAQLKNDNISSCFKALSSAPKPQQESFSLVTTYLEVGEVEVSGNKAQVAILRPMGRSEQEIDKVDKGALALQKEGNRWRVSYNESWWPGSIRPDSRQSK